MPQTPVVRSKHRDRDFGLRRGLLLGDLAAVSVALLIAMAVSDHRGSVSDALWVLVTLPGWAFLFSSYQLYRRPIQSFEPTHLDDLSPLFHAMVIGTLGLWAFFKVLPVPQLTLKEVAVFWLLGLCFAAVLRVVTRRLNLRKHGADRVLVIAEPADVKVLMRKLGNHPEYEMAVVGAITGDGPDENAVPDLPVETSLADLEIVLAEGRVDLVIVRLDSEFVERGRIEGLMYACFRHGVRFGAYPGPRGLLLPGAQLNHIEGMGILTHDPPILPRSSRLMKRGLDLLVSSVALVVCAPFMALIALAIRLDDRGPVLFGQTRVGKDGRRFRVLKFRTMVPDAETMTERLMAESADPDWLDLEDDPRITRIGHFLRNTSLDELPQLWNVLKGEMSMVGPRPLSEVDDSGLAGWERHRLDLVPGITGNWQVLGRTTIPFREMVEIDYAYVTGWSLWLDVKILIRTIPIVLTRRGAN